MKADRIKEMRKAQGWTQRDLAREMMVSRSTVAMWEVEANDIPTPTLERLAGLLHTSPAYLLGWTDDPTDYDSDDLADVSPEIIKRAKGNPREARRLQKAMDDSAQEEWYNMSDPSTARQDLFDDPDRKALLSFARNGSPEAVRQVNALIDALKATNPEFYDGDDPA